MNDRMNTPLAPRCLRRPWRTTAAGLGLSLALAATAAHAQDVDATGIVQGGLAAVQLVDRGSLGELWDGASDGARKKVARNDFARQVTQARQPLGAPLQRTWVAINRHALANDDGDLAGQYVSVEYETRFAGKPERAARELVSFHLGRDGTWRFSGYVLRQP